VYQRGGSLFAVPFDARKLAVTGAAVAVVQGVATGTNNGDPHYAVSDNGTLVYVPGTVMQVDRALLWVDRKGNEEKVVPTLRPYAEPALSPDGRTIALTLESATFDIWQLDIERDSLSRLSFGGDDTQAVWSIDGRRIFWQSTRTGRGNIFSAPADGSGTEERVTATDREQWARQMSPDGRLLLGTEYRPGTGYDVVTLPLAGDRKSQSLVASKFNEHGASFSPDGKWMIYTSDESGNFEIYLRPYPGPGGKWQVSTGGADEAYFAHNGREIFYRHDGRYYVVPIEWSPQVRPGKGQLLFEKPYSSWGGISADDQRLLVVREMTPLTSNELRIVLNWFEDLRRVK
jgi:Tol biopolymer transport system component